MDVRTRLWNALLLWEEWGEGMLIKMVCKVTYYENEMKLGEKSSDVESTSRGHLQI